MQIRNDDPYVAHLVRHSKSRRGKLLSGDKYFNPQTIGLVWTNPSDRVYSINGTQVADSLITWTNLFDESSLWFIDVTISSYVAGSLDIGGSAITANGTYTVEIDNADNLDLVFTANTTLNATVTINTVKRLS